MPDIQYHALKGISHFQDAVRLQRRVWGFADIDVLPLNLFVVATKVGGQAFGAFRGRRMLGFCVAIPALKPGGKSYLHSHMLGVLLEYNNIGIGRRLKLMQREDALARDIDLIEWTFDPLEIKNAYFNLERLGVIVRRYAQNEYGTTTSHLHGGLPTDRCVAEWWVTSDRHVNITFRRNAPAKLQVLPFPGAEQEVGCNRGVCVIPSIERGAIVWPR